jgi:hypothetical protein
MAHSDHALIAAKLIGTVRASARRKVKGVVGGTPSLRHHVLQIDRHPLDMIRHSAPQEAPAQYLSVAGLATASCLPIRTIRRLLNGGYLRPSIHYGDGRAPGFSEDQVRSAIELAARDPDRRVRQRLSTW